MTSERRAKFDRTEFRARLALVGVLGLALLLLPDVAARGPLAGVVVLVAGGGAHFLVRRLAGVPNPTGWLDLVAVVTATVVTALDPTLWTAAFLFQAFVVSGGLTFLSLRWTVVLGVVATTSMGLLALVHRPDGALLMLLVAIAWLPVFLAGARRKRARLRRASHRMEAVATSLPMVVWEWDITRSRMGAVVGRSDDVFGRSADEVLQHGLMPHVHPEDLPRFTATYRTLVRGRGPESVELDYRSIRPDGSTVWLRDRATVALGSEGPVVRGVTIDRTETRAQELDLDRHRQIVERMPALTVVVSCDDWTVLQVVDPIGWGGTDGTGADRGPGRLFTEVFPGLAGHRPLIDAVEGLSDGAIERVGPWPSEDGNGSTRWVEVELFPLPGRTVALLVDDVTDREEMLARLRHQAHHDDLTGLLNRSALMQVATQAIREQRPCSLLLVDLNDFKSINDTLGHLTGDHFLAVIGQRLRLLALDGEHVTRLGGDEFAILSVGAPRARMERLVDDVVAACRKPVTLHGVPLAGSASVGVASASPSDGDASAESLLRRADLAMYHAKANQSGASWYHPSMERSADPLRLLGGLAQAFEHDEFVMHYQPKVDARTGRTIAFEALVRWEHPQLGVLQPGAFLDLIAVSGHLDSLGAIAVREAARALAQLPEHISVAINLTAQNLRNLDFPALCDRVFADEGVGLDRLIVEVTESHMLDTSGVTHSVIGDLAARGISVSVDDFGTGFSSLTHLRSLPLDELKIDRRFVSNLVHDDQDLVIVRSVIDLGHNLGLHVVAEGVEDHDTLVLLRSLGCDVVQGYHLGRPESLVTAIARCDAERVLAELDEVRPSSSPAPWPA